jgi:pimeloyl-ACP methyl ester carboxylesterase
VNEGLFRAAEQRLWTSHGATPTERRLHLDRNDVDVRLQEVGAGPPILFIHGANTSGASWVPLAARLADFRCLILDRPGTGLSQPLRGRVDARAMADLGDTLVADVLDAMNLNSAHVVATSLGGYIALRSAAAQGDHIRRMVQFSWPVGAPTAWVPSFMRVLGLPGVGRIMAALPATERSVRMTFRRIGHGTSLDAGRITRADLDCYLAMLRYTETIRNEVAVARAFVSPFRGLGRTLLPSALLARVETPIHFLWGGNDPFGDAETGHQLIRLLPHATLEVVTGAGHAPWLDDLDRCETAVRNHLVEGRSAH